MTDRSSDDDWVSEMLARAMLEQDADRPPRPPQPPVPTHRERAVRPAAAEAPPVPVRSLEERTEPERVAPPADAPTDEPAPAPAAVGPRPVPVEPPAAGTDTAEVSVEPTDDVTDPRPGNTIVRSIVEWVVVIVGALAVALVLRTLLFQAFFIPSESMEPTLQNDDRVLVNKLSYRLHDVNRGDIVVFERPPGQGPSDIHDLIKRVIALEGETVSGQDGRIIIDDMLLVETYLPDGTLIADFGPIVVPEDHVFVMGDNRGNSQDSRVFGPIPEGSIVGRAFVLFWPLNRLGPL